MLGKTTFSLAVVLFLVSGVAQGQQNKAVPPPKSNIPVANVSFRADESADLIIDGRAIGKLQPGNLLSRKLELGDHLIQATSSDGQMHWEKVITIENIYNKIVTIELIPIRQQRSVSSPEPTAGAIANRRADVPPPPKPSDDGPSLEGTMKFIRDTLGEAENGNYKFISDPTTCMFEARVTDPQTPEYVMSILFKDIARVDVSPDSVDNSWNLLTVTSAQGTRPFKWHQEDRSGDTDRWNFIFGEYELANRVAKAMVRAVELCGGGSNNPS